MSSPIPTKADVVRLCSMSQNKYGFAEGSLMPSSKPIDLYTPHSSRMMKKTEPTSKALLGSYEESLLMGRLSTPSSAKLKFHVEIGVLALCKTKSHLKCPPHINIPFSAVFYELNGSSHKMSSILGSPFVGTIDLTHSMPSVHRKYSVVSTSTFERPFQRPRSVSDSHLSNQSIYDSTNCPSVPRTFTDSSVEIQPSDRIQINKSIKHSDEIHPSDRIQINKSTKNAFEQEWFDPNGSLLGGISNLDLSPPRKYYENPKASYQLPLKGQLQLIIKNENGNVVKIFLVPYDLRDMPEETRTFLRQKTYAVSKDDSYSRSLRFVVHLHFICLSNGKSEKRLYLYKSIRVIFAHRAFDSDERSIIVYERPFFQHSPVYIPLEPTFLADLMTE